MRFATLVLTIVFLFGVSANAELGDEIVWPDGALVPLSHFLNSTTAGDINVTTIPDGIADITYQNICPLTHNGHILRVANMNYYLWNASKEGNEINLDTLTNLVRDRFWEQHCKSGIECD